MGSAMQETSNIIEVCKILSQDHNLRVTVEESTKGALVAGAGALFGGLLGGPIGLGIGGTLGSLIAAYRGSGTYKSLVTIISELTPQQKEKLANAVQKCINNLNAADVIMLLSIIRSNASIQELILKEMGNFVMDEFGKAMIK